jgi:hypothetical protein
VRGSSSPSVLFVDGHTCSEMNAGMNPWTMSSPDVNAYVERIAVDTRSITCCASGYSIADAIR